MTRDPLQKMLDQHIHVSEWLHMLKEAGECLDLASETIDFPKLQTFFKVNVMEHMKFEEQRIFPALEAIDPSTAPLVASLLREHLPILADAGRMFGQLARHAAGITEEDAQTRLLVKQVVDRLLAHAAREDAELLPLVSRHRDAIRSWSPLAE